MSTNSLQPVHQVIACHVRELRQRLHPLNHFRHPLIEQPGVGRLQGVLVLGAADPVFDRQVLHRLQVQAGARNLAEGGLHPLDDLRHPCVALGQRLELDQHPAGIRRRVLRVHADVGRQALHRRILQHHPRQRLLAFGHRRKRHALGRLRDSLDHAGVLHRKEALGHHEVKRHCQYQRHREHHERQGLVIQHPAQHAGVGRDDPVEAGADRTIEAAALGHRPVPQQLDAHHRRQRQRDHRRDQDRDRERDRELAEQAADDVAHEQQRNQDRDQREGQRNDGEGDLARAVQRRLHAAQRPPRCSARCSRSRRWHRPRRIRWRRPEPSRSGC